MIQVTNLQLSGLTCGACEKLVTKRLKTIEGVREIHISLADGQTSITATRLISNNEVTKVLQDTHYKVISTV